MFVVVVDDLFSVIHAAVADFDCVTIKGLSNFVVFGKCLSTMARNLCRIVVLTFLLNEGVLSAYVVLLTVFSFVSCGCFIM